MSTKIQISPGQHNSNYSLWPVYHNCGSLILKYNFSDIIQQKKIIIFCRKTRCNIIYFSIMLEVGKTLYECRVCNYLHQALPCARKNIECFKCHRVFVVPESENDKLQTPTIVPQVKNRKFYILSICQYHVYPYCWGVNFIRVNFGLPKFTITLLLLCPLMSWCRSRILINQLKNPWYAPFCQNKTKEIQILNMLIIFFLSEKLFSYIEIIVKSALRRHQRT